MKCAREPFVFKYYFGVHKPHCLTAMGIRNQRQGWESFGRDRTTQGTSVPGLWEQHQRPGQL